MKNGCNELLFENEDKKYRLDQLIYELRYLVKRPEMISKYRKFGLIKR
jgi:hypothetical protein